MQFTQNMLPICKIWIRHFVVASQSDSGRRSDRLRVGLGRRGYDAALH